MFLERESMCVVYDFLLLNKNAKISKTINPQTSNRNNQKKNSVIFFFFLNTQFNKIPNFKIKLHLQILIASLFPVTKNIHVKNKNRLKLHDII